MRNLIKALVDWVKFAFDVPFARADVFGVNIGGHLFVKDVLLVVIVFLLSQKSYKPPKRPLTKKEIDELCDEWTPESLIPLLTQEMQRQPPKLQSAARPHTIINGKDVLNFENSCPTFTRLYKPIRDKVFEQQKTYFDLEKEHTRLGEE
ncbi:hypothetical protein RND81_14G154000 [Saponaria officinalis]|uniref:Uncharacterized protein n=1 Tax=Saponaria officinalis TaxID=3572 RepID=A0AAW1GSK7_SAPOF